MEIQQFDKIKLTQFKTRLQLSTESSRLKDKMSFKGSKLLILSATYCNPLETMGDKNKQCQNLSFKMNNYFVSWTTLLLENL